MQFLLRILLALTIITISLIKVSTANNYINYDYTSKDGFNIYFDDIGRIKIGADAECGFVRDGALYASFGLEGQIYHCSKVIFNIDGAINSAIDDHKWLFKVDFAPLYNSIKTEIKDRIIYGKDGLGNEIDGNNRYFDWYKNLGTRTYYLGNVPLIESYIGYRMPNHFIKLGRVKNIVGLEDEEVFWRDDAKFAPMGHWLSRDLLSGAIYGFNYSFLELAAGVFSGSNPHKGYSNYLDKVESPNIKSNNTPSYSGRIKLKYKDLEKHNFSSYIYASYFSNVTGSTWDDGLQDGKRNASVGAFGGVLDVFFDNQYFNAVKLFGQYNYYLSGLKAGSSQNDGTKRFKNISQKGYFVGAELIMLDDNLSLGAAYENFDRFDYNIFEYFSFSDRKDLKNLKQKSKIFNIKYKINEIISVGAAYHIIDNPLLYVSNILDSKKTNRVKFSLYVNL